MTPEADRFLQKARAHLNRAALMLGIGLREDAGRAAYLACFHAAQAFIFETTGKVLKSHNGVQTEFLRLSKDDQRFGADLRVFLSQAYNLKAIADYETGPESGITAERAAAAIDMAKAFVARIAVVISG